MIEYLIKARGDLEERIPDNTNLKDLLVDDDPKHQNSKNPVAIDDAPNEVEQILREDILTSNIQDIAFRKSREQL